jgi:hypothetical protein
MPESHTRKSAYATILDAIDALSRIQTHAKSSAQPLSLTPPDAEQLRKALEESREAARTGDW